MQELMAKARPLSTGIVFGFRGSDGRFEEARGGREWLIFQEPEDEVFWCPSTGQVATSDGRAFALGEATISNASTYAFGYALNIFGSVARWILADGDGIFVLDWRNAFDKLRYAPRIEIDQDLRSTYDRAMRPRLPQVKVRFRTGRAAA